VNAPIRTLAALVTIASLAACSGGCHCTVPPINGPTAAPGVVPQASTSPAPSPAGSHAPGTSPSPTSSLLASPSPVVTLDCNQGTGAIPLGPALAPFAVLGASAVTNVGATIVGFSAGATTLGVDDDLIGVSPGTAITGFYPPGTDVDGTNAIYGAGYNTDAAVPLAAQNALTIAYTTAAATASTAAVTGDLSQASVPGHATGTLPPGVYTSTSALSIAAGNLTLDGGGNAQAVFIFQMASTLTTLSNGALSGNVILTNGANACNVYWQVGTSATLGGASFSGDVFADVAITINATTFNGRALARSGAVTIPVAGGSLITNPGGN